MIEVSGLEHSYENGAVVLENVSFRIRDGEKVVLLGANGCGKTTLLKILDALVYPSQGEYLYRGRPVTKQTLEDAGFRRTFRSEVALLFQNPDAMLFNPTVYDEIAFGPRQHDLENVDERTRQWADEFGLTRLLDRPPFELSRGEKQRVCLAALLAVDPKLLLLDEPTANLDPRSTGWLVDYLQAIDATTVVTTHNLSLAAELGERTLLLSERHALMYDGPLAPLTADREKLIEANLVHVHKHRHRAVEHEHFHTHDWE
jgi:cobalt/nickel transport system ATP-binding protein